MLARKLCARAIAGNISSLTWSNGEEVHLDSQIVEEFRRFYQRLYSAESHEPPDAQAYQESRNFTRLPPVQAEQLEDPHQVGRRDFRYLPAEA